MTKIAGATAVILCLMTSLAWAVPRVMVPDHSFNFGTISQGDKVKHAFVFKNVGDEPLKVTKVRSSCGCTAVLASADTLAPGESGEIQANFDSTRFRGSVSKTIYLYTNDTVTPVMQLYIKGKINEIVTIEPAKVNLGKVVIDEPAVASVTLMNRGNKDLVLVPPTTTAQELSAEIDRLELPAGESAAVQVRLKAKPGCSRFSGYVLIDVNGATTSELRIPVYATLQ